ncbi:MAG: YfhO family protein [Clostridiaceae bacterium]|nr:YfhO family protein [Clostridiaceae bacterium]
MQTPSLLQDKWRREERLQRLIAFALPALAFYFGFVAHGLWPFGNRHLLAYDLYHQYAPFLLELKRKILSGDSLFFSWSGGLGVDYYSIFTYYTASPLNLLTLLFPDRYIAEAVSLITILKIGLASLFFREFLTGAFRRRDPLASLFSAFYALSAWVYAYSWNIMWLDTLVLFPLACLGLVQLVRDRRPGRFILALTLMLMTNYYAAFFACVFLFLYYFLVRIQFPGQAGQGLKARLIPFGLFAGSSLLSALLSAVILWPTAKALSITSAAGDAFPSGFSFNQPLLDTLGRMTPLRSPHIMSGLPNIFAGLFVLFLVPAFFASRKRPLKVRVAYGLLLGFLFFSFQSRTLSFLWHGGHYPNSLDYRYAFVFVLLVLVMAYQAVGDNLASKRAWTAISALVLFIFLLFEQVLGEDQGSLSHWRIWVSLSMTLVYLLILGRMEGPQDLAISQVPAPGAHYDLTGRHQIKRSVRPHPLAPLPLRRTRQADPRVRAKQSRYRYMQTALFLFLAVEVLFHAFTAALLYQEVAPLGDRQYYTSNPYASEVYAYTKELKESHKGQPWRAEILPDTCVNDPFLYGSNGMSLFASPFPQASIRFFSDLGYPTNGVNSFQYKESTIVMDSLLAIDHLIVKESRIFDDRTRQLVSQGQHSRLLVNEDALSFGFFATAEADYLNDEIMPEDSPDVQNRLLSALSGAAGVLVKEAFQPWEYEGCYVDNAYDPFRFNVYREEGNSEWALLVYHVPQDGIYYIFWEDESVGINYSNGFVRDQEFFQLGSSKRGMGDVGFLEAGTELHFRVSMPSEQTIDGTFRACVARLDQEAWQEARERLAAHPLELDHFSSTRFSGQIEAPRQGYLFLPTTGNPGWTFKVDGVETQAQTIRGAFIILPLEAGSHRIEARFVPLGFYSGLGLSLASATGLALFCLVRRRRKKSQEAAVKSRSWYHKSTK